MGYGLVNYRKGFMLYLVFTLFLTRNITFFSIVPISTLMAVYYILLYFLNKGKKSRCKVSFPWSFPNGCLALSMIISSLFSIAGVQSEINTLLGNVTKEIILLWLIWRMIETKEDYRFIFKAITVVMFISCVYGILELMLQNNYLADYTRTLVSETKVVDWEYSVSGRGYRVYSIFEHATGAGMNWSIYVIFVLCQYLKDKSVFKNYKLPIITAALCIPCIFFTKMRAPFVFLAIGLLMLVQLTNKKFYRMIPLFAIGLIILIPLLNNNMDLITSIFNSRTRSETVGGSSLALRMTQFNTSISLMSRQPLTGLGTAFRSVLSASETYWLFGLESVAISVPLQYGVIGIVAYIIRFIFDIVIIPRRFKCKHAMILSLAYWFTRLVSSTPGFSLILYYLFLFYLIKNTDTYQKKSNEVKNGTRRHGLYIRRAKLHV